jgi:AraC-like DNA-binding protein
LALAAKSGPQRVVQWSRLALDAGYYDQAHFAGEFKTLTGYSPTRFLAESSGRFPIFQDTESLTG